MRAPSSLWWLLAGWLFIACSDDQAPGGGNPDDASAIGVTDAGDGSVAPNDASSSADATGSGDDAGDDAGGNDAGVGVDAQLGPPGPWVEMPTPVKAVPPVDTAYFGDSFALSADGRTLAVGAPCENVDAVTCAGAAYIFERSGNAWTQVIRLTSSTQTTRQFFGEQVALTADGRWLAVAVPLDSQAAPGAGAVFVYERRATGWTPSGVLRPVDVAAGDRFGTAIAFSPEGDLLLVGAPSDDSGMFREIDSEPDSGAIYVYRRGMSGFEEEHFLKDDPPTESGGFGGVLAVSLGGQYIIAPTAGGLSAFVREGVAYRRSASHSAAYGLGASLAITPDGTFVAAGAPSADSGGTLISDPTYPGNDTTRDSGGVLLLDFDGGSLVAGPFLKWILPQAGVAYGKDVAVSDDGTAVLVGLDRTAAEFWTLDVGGWARQDLVVSHPLEAGAEDFGRSVAMSGDGRTAAIGARHNDVGAPGSGAVYIYTR